MGTATSTVFEGSLPSSILVRRLSGDPLPPLRAELQGRSPAGRGGGVHLLRADGQRSRAVRRGLRAG